MEINLEIGVSRIKDFRRAPFTVLHAQPHQSLCEFEWQRFYTYDGNNNNLQLSFDVWRSGFIAFVVDSEMPK